MKISTLIAVSFLFASMIVNKSQAQSAADKLPQIAVINSLMMEDPATGIKKLNDALVKLDAEFKAPSAELKAMQTKYDGLAKSIQNAGSQGSQAKVEEADRLSRDIKFKSEDLQTKYNKRYSELTTPVFNAAWKATTDWARKNRYDMLIDISKDEKGVFLLIEEDKINALTKELIIYINGVLK